MWSILTDAGVLLNSSDSLVRIVMRVYFTVVLLVVMYIGSEICVLRPQLFLLKKGRVPVMEMTGWLSAFDATRAMWLTRSLKPLGLMGFVMIFVGTMMTVSDLAVSGFIAARDVPARCVLNEKSSPFYVYPGSEAVVGPLLEVASPFMPQTEAMRRAVTTSRQNGGPRGILRVLDLDPKFRADETDVIGSWRCEDRGEVPQHFSWKLNNTEPLRDLVYAGYLHKSPEEIPWDRGYYHNEEYLNIGSDGKPNNTDLLPYNIIYWSTNYTMYPDKMKPEGGPWELLAVIEKTHEHFADHVFQAYKCHLEAPTVEWLFDHLDPVYIWSSASWYNIFGNYLIDTDDKVVGNPMEVMEDTMNMMWMIGGLPYGANGSLVDEDRKKGARMAYMDSSGTKGCLISKTNVPWPIITMFLAAGLLLIWSIAYFSFLWWRVRQAARARSQDGSVPYVPVGLMSWVKHAATYTPDGGYSNVHTRVLTKYVYGIKDGRSMTMRTDDEEGVRTANELSNAPSIKLEFSTDDNFKLPIEGAKEMEKSGRVVELTNASYWSPSDMSVSAAHIEHGGRLQKF